MTKHDDFLAPGERFTLDADDATAALLSAGVLEAVDWSGEDEPGQIEQFVTRRPQAFDVGSRAVENVHSASAAALDTDLDRGEHVPRLLRAIDAALEPTTVAIGEVRRGDDTYVIGVMRRTDSSLATWGLGRPASDSMYVIDCPCGGMNMWVLPTDSLKPDEGECESCGRALFDSSGASIYPMTSEPA